MCLRKPIFFGLLFILIVSPFWLGKLLWVIRSKPARGVFAFGGMGFAGDQVKKDYSVIRFPVGEDTIWFSGLGNLSYKPGDMVPIRYQPDNVYDARVDIFAGIWGDTLVYSGIPTFMLLMLFLHRGVVPWRSSVRLSIKKPFLKLVPWAKK